MNSAPVYPVEIAGLQRAVGQACDLLANLGESPDLHAPARGASSRVSRLAAYGASDPVMAEAVQDLRVQAGRLAWRIEAIKVSTIARGNAIAVALTKVEEASLARANGWGLAGTCPAAPDAKTPAAQAEVSRVAAGSAAATASLTAPTCGLGQRHVGGGIG